MELEFLKNIKKALPTSIVGFEIQVFLCVISLAFAFFLSQLIKRMVQRKFSEDHKYIYIIRSIANYILPPFLLVLILSITSGWADTLIPEKININLIRGLMQLTTALFLVRILLVISHKHFMAYFFGFIIMAITVLGVTELLDPVQHTLNEIAYKTDKVNVSLLDIIKGLFALIILFWGAGVISKSGESWLQKMNLTFNARELSIKFLRIFLYFIAFVLSLQQMGIDLTALTVFGGVIAVGLGFGLQKITSNFLSGLILLFEQAIEAGDLIEVGNEKGWVRKMALRHTLIETFDGREIMIPNEDLIIGKVISWTYSNTRARVDINMTLKFNTNIELAQKLLTEAALAYKLCIRDQKPAAHLKEFNNHGIHVMLIFWIPDVKEGVGIARSTVMLNILKAFHENGIMFAEVG